MDINFRTCGTEPKAEGLDDQGLQSALRFFFFSVARSYLTLRDPVDCSLPGYSIHGIFQTRILEWVAIPFSRDSSGPRD